MKTCFEHYFFAKPAKRYHICYRSTQDGSCTGGETLFILSHNFHSQKMTKTSQSSGSWSKVQEDKLQQLLANNIIDYRNRSPNYLYQVTQDYFGDFISEGPQGRNTVIQHMRGKFIKYEEVMRLRGARGKCYYSYT